MFNGDTETIEELPGIAENAQILHRTTPVIIGDKVFAQSKQLPGHQREMLFVYDLNFKKWTQQQGINSDKESYEYSSPIFYNHLQVIMNLGFKQAIWIYEFLEIVHGDIKQILSFLYLDKVKKSCTSLKNPENEKLKNEFIDNCVNKRV